jgi:hypothetical protein
MASRACGLSHPCFLSADLLGHRVHSLSPADPNLAHDLYRKIKLIFLLHSLKISTGICLKQCRPTSFFLNEKSTVHMCVPPKPGVGQGPGPGPGLGPGPG